MKYEITDIVHPGNAKLFRIRALRAIPSIGVKVSDLGGYIEKEHNLSQEGNCWVSGNALVSGNAWVYDNALVYGNARVFGNAQLISFAWVCGEVVRVYKDMISNPTPAGSKE